MRFPIYKDDFKKKIKLNPFQSPEYVLLSSRERANLINRNVTTWLGGPWGLTANVIEIDFILSSNIIDIAIYNNRNKKSDVLKGYVSFDMPWR